MARRFTRVIRRSCELHSPGKEAALVEVLSANYLVCRGKRLIQMLKAQFFFLPDLNNFLPHDYRSGRCDCVFEAGQSIKHLIESLGVPHTEVGQMLVNQQEKDFDYLVVDGDQVEVFPATASQGMQPPEPRFVLDNHLGRLAAYLRMLGFDVNYRNNFDDEELAQISAAESRILLTRDRRLLMRKAVRYGYCLRSLDSRQQLSEVVRRFALSRQITPFHRCVRCNTILETVSKQTVIDQLQPLTRQYFEEFQRCPACGQVYWKGSHYEQMQRMIDQIQKEEI